MPHSVKRALARVRLPIIAWPIFGTGVFMLVAVGFNALAFQGMPPDIFMTAIHSAIVLPVILGLPLFTIVTMRLMQMANVNRQLGIAATVDSLTNCLNRGAFTASVDRVLEQPSGRQSGALLVIDADNFKSINDRFGHDRGDQALIAIAQAIKQVLRDTDLVGRIGGEEFAVYLSNADRRTADLVAERIRRAVNLSDFAPEGEARQLSVSIGGTAYDGPVDFLELFQTADRRLYEAKQFGRNRVEVGGLNHSTPPPAPSPIPATGS